MSKRFAVIGHPVAHSLSPRIHQAFSQQLSIPLDYLAIDAGPVGFEEALAAFARAGADGVNVTLPYKQQAAAVCVRLDPRAQRAGAVNVLTRGDDGWVGDNTDGIGLVRDLTGRQHLDLRQRRTLLLGAGGGARGVAPALLDAGIGELTLVNRDADRADALADLLAEPGRVHTRYYDDLGTHGEFDLIINATSAGRDGRFLKLPRSLVGRRTAAVDLSYGEAAIGYLAWARASNCHDVIDGLGMLVEQAAESFLLWHGTRPDTDAIYAELREHNDSLVTAD